MHRFETKQRGFFEIKGKIWVNNSKKQDFELKYRCSYRNFKNCCTAVAPQFTAVKISFSNTAHNTAQHFYLCAVLFCTKFHSGTNTVPNTVPTRYQHGTNKNFKTRDLFCDIERSVPSVPWWYRDGTVMVPCFFRVCSVCSVFVPCLVSCLVPCWHRVCTVFVPCWLIEKCSFSNNKKIILKLLKNKIKINLAYKFFWCTHYFSFGTCCDNLHTLLCRARNTQMLEFRSCIYIHSAHISLNRRRSGGCQSELFACSLIDSWQRSRDHRVVLVVVFGQKKNPEIAG